MPCHLRGDIASGSVGSPRIGNEHGDSTVRFVESHGKGFPLSLVPHSLAVFACLPLKKLPVAVPSRSSPTLTRARPRSRKSFCCTATPSTSPEPLPPAKI